MCSPKKLGREFLDYILKDGWIDIAGQCATTISVRNSESMWGVRYVGGRMYGE